MLTKGDLIGLLKSEKDSNILAILQDFSDTERIKALSLKAQITMKMVKAYLVTKFKDRENKADLQLKEQIFNILTNRIISEPEAKKSDTDKKTEITTSDIVYQKAIDTFINEGKPVGGISVEDKKRKAFFAKHPDLIPLLEAEENNPILEEGHYNSLTNRSRIGEHYLTYEALKLLINKKILNHKTKPGGLEYNKNNVFIIKNNTEELETKLSNLNLKNGEDSKFIYISGIHAVPVYIRNDNGQIKCFIVDPEPVHGNPNDIINSVEKVFPNSFITLSKTHLQKDFYSCSTFATKALMYFAKHGDKVFPYIEKMLPSQSGVFELAPKDLMPNLLKMCQTDFDDIKLGENLNQIVSTKSKKTLKQYWQEHKTTFGKWQINTAALKKKYRYLEEIDDELKLLKSKETTQEKLYKDSKPTHPLNLFKQLLSEKKPDPNDFKNTLALLDEPTQKHYASVLEKGLHSIQLSPEETNAVNKLLKDKNCQIQKFNYQAYGELLFLTRLACQFEENQDAELHAMKLTAMFGTANDAIEYLKKFQNLITRKQLIHDACLFEPPSDNLDYAIWQSLAVKYMPNKEFEKLLPFAHKIQAFVEKHRAADEKEIWEKLVNNLELSFLITESDYIKAQMKKFAKKIHKQTNKLLENWSKEQLKIFHQQLTPDRKQIKKQCRSQAGQFEKENIRKQIEAEYEEKFKKDFKEKSPNSIKSAEIKQQIAKLKSSIPPNIHQKSKSTGWRKTLEENFKNSAKTIYSKETDLATLLKYVGKVFYARSHENLDVSKLFFSLGLSEESFNKYLELKPRDDPKQIPEVFIDGETIGYPGFYIKKLPPTDPKAAVLGKLTSCCQSLGEAGEAPAIFGITDPRAGFYVLYQKKTTMSVKEDSIVSQCLAWRGQHDDMVFDSIESKGDFQMANEPLIINMFMKLANHLVKECSVPIVLVGTRGLTPASLGKKVEYAETPMNYKGYRDSSSQRLLTNPTHKMLLQRVFPSVDSKMIDTHIIEQLGRVWARTGIVSKEILIDEIMDMGKHLHLSIEELTKQLDLFRVEYLLSRFKEWTDADHKELLKYLSTSLDRYRYLVLEKNEKIFYNLIMEISHPDRLAFISSLGDLDTFTSAQKQKLFFMTMTIPDVASLKQLLEMSPFLKADVKNAFSIATDIEVKRLLLSMDIAELVNTSTETESDQRLFSQKLSDKSAITALHEALEQKLSPAALNQLTKAHPSLKEPPLKDYFRKVESLSPLVILLGHIVRGEKEEAEAVLKAAENNPTILKSLLCEKLQVVDYSGRTIEGTALQLAWGAEDVSRAAFPDEGMEDMLMVHLRKLLDKDADAEITKQYAEQFPEEEEKEEIDRNERDLAALNKVIEAVAEAKVQVINDNKTIPDGKCQKALDDFRNYLAPKGVIKTGKHFNVNLLVEAFNLYDKKFDEFGGNVDSPRNMLFWQQVIGSIQRLLPACYAQAFCQGLQSGKLYRVINIACTDKFFFPLDSKPSFRLGFEYAVWEGVYTEGGSRSRVDLQNLCQAKAEHFASLRRNRSEASKLIVGRSSV